MRDQNIMKVEKGIKDGVPESEKERDYMTLLKRVNVVESIIRPRND